MFVNVCGPNYLTNNPLNAMLTVHYRLEAIHVFDDFDTIYFFRDGPAKAVKTLLRSTKVPSDPLHMFFGSVVMYHLYDMLSRESEDEQQPFESDTSKKRNICPK